VRVGSRPLELRNSVPFAFAKNKFFASGFRAPAVGTGEKLLNKFVAASAARIEVDRNITPIQGAGLNKVIFRSPFFEKIGNADFRPETTHQAHHKKGILLRQE
jgi:hypothetical protein